MEDNLRISLLYDFYGQLLNENMQKAVELYYNDDLSLSETADIMGISRQGVRDAIYRASKKLSDFEQKLGLVARFEDEQKTLKNIIADAKQISKLSEDKYVTSLANSIEKSASSLYEQEI